MPSTQTDAAPSTFDALVARGQCSTEEAFDLFDSLPAVPTASMIGKWRGADFPTGHPMDGHLETISWYGKEFLDEERVHPLVCRDARGRFFNLDPKFLGVPMALSSRVPSHPALKTVFAWTKGPITTRKPRARLRMVEYRGKSSATMIYDHLPIYDTFRRVDDDTVLGMMDLRGVEPPYFFVLRRDA